MTGTNSRSVAALLTVIVLVAGCSTNAAPSPPPITPSTDAPDVSITPAAASPTAPATPATPTPSATPRPTPKPTPVPVPPKPTGVKFDVQERESDDEEVLKITQTVTWRAPRSEGVEIRVYGVTDCIAYPAHPRPGAHGPCLVVHTPMPASVRRLLATAPASDGVVSWTWTEPSGCMTDLPSAPDGPAYYAVVLAAYSASGHSIFAIAEPGVWWEPAPGDQFC